MDMKEINSVNNSIIKQIRKLKQKISQRSNVLFNRGLSFSQRSIGYGAKV